MISRTRFLKRAGGVLTLPMFLEYCKLHPRLTGPDSSDPIANAKALGLNDPILIAINVGITAPNPHNTQAWKFKILGPLEMQLFVDAARILPVTDPSTRQIHIGQGTFLELLSIGAKEIGYSAQIKPFPEGEYTIEQIGKKPVAHVKLVQDRSGDRDALYSAIPVRATNRDEYDGPMLTDAEMKDLIRGADQKYSKQSYVLGDKLPEYCEIFDKSMRVETINLRTADESRRWFRFNDNEIQTKRDGIALPDQAVTGMTRWIAETFFMGPEPEKFFDPKGNELFLQRYKKKIDSAKAILYWTTNENHPTDWVNCGRDYARFHLNLTKAGLKMHPLSQVLQEFSEMKELRERFENLTGVKAPSKVQMVVRIGRSDYQYFTPRRSVKDMLV